MARFLVVILLAGVLRAQTPVPEAKDPLGRNTPQDSVFHFLEACHARDYSKALRYLDLRRMPPARARQRRPGTGTPIGRSARRHSVRYHHAQPRSGGRSVRRPFADRDRLDTFQVDGQTVELQLERVELKPGFHVWLVSADSIPLIPKAHQLVAETPFEKKLPQRLVEFEIFDTPVWRWIALVIMALALWIASGIPIMGAGDGGAAGGQRVGISRSFARWFGGGRIQGGDGNRALGHAARLFVDRALGLIFFLAVAWAAAVVVDLITERWRSRLDPRVQAVSYSVLPLGRQVLKLSLFLFAILSVLSVWGYNTSTILAGLGVGGLAVALAAQKTIENLFGGISVIGDRPVLVGDVCRFGDRTGTVMHIGLRSTRIRTPDRTIISVPNSQFSSMALENISGRDKIWFHPTLNLRQGHDVGPVDEGALVLSRDPAEPPQSGSGSMPVRFVGVGAYSLDIEVVAYVTTSDYDEFLALQQELLLKMLQAVEQAGTALAVPLQESFASRRPAEA